MSAKQPEAMRLADALDLLWMDGRTPQIAAAELRRLHSVNAETLNALEKLHEAQKRAENLPIFADTYAQESVRFLLYDGMVAAQAAIAKATKEQA